MRTHLLVSAGLLALASAIPAVAQDTQGAGTVSGVSESSRPTSPDMLSQDIVVTANRRSESINRVPLAVQAITPDTLKKLKIADVQSLATAVPGLSVSPAYSGVPIFTLRGIGFNTVNITATSTVGIYQDELAYAYPSMAGGPIYDLERVEVLKGPQGTLYGRNTTAGLIDFITAKPKHEYAAGLTVEGGNYDTVNVEGYVNAPLGDKAAIRISGRSENSFQGWQIDNSRGDRLGKVHRWGLRGELTFAPTDRFDMFLSVSGWRDRSDTQAGQAIGLNLTNRLGLASPAFGPGDVNTPGLLAYLAANQPTRASQAGFNSNAALGATVGLAAGVGAPKADSSFVSGQARFTWRASDAVSIIAITGYSDFTRRDVVDFSGAPYEIIATQYDARIKSFSQEVRAETVGDGFRLAIGGYYGHDDLRENNRFLIGQNSSVAFLRLAALQVIANPVTNALFNNGGYTVADIANGFREGAGGASGTSETYSGFVNGEVQLADKLKLIGGARVGMDRTQLSGCSRDYNGNYLPITNTAGRAIIFQTYGVIAPPVVANGCSTYDPTVNQDVLVHTVLDESNFSGRLAINYQPTDATMLYASVARGIKSGNIPIVPANRSVQFTPAVQEKLTAYEAGIKTALGGRFAQLNVSGFYYDYTNKQFSSYVPDPTFGALQRLVNIPKSDAWGVDGELTLRPGGGFTLSGNATYLRTKIKNYIGANAAGISTNFSGDEFSFAPRFSGSVIASFDTPITDALNFQATGNVTHQSSSHSDFGEDPLFGINARTLVNGSIGIGRADGGWGLTLWARNLTNKYYWTSVVDNQNLNVRYAGRPRTFGASLSVNFK